MTTHDQDARPSRNEPRAALEEALNEIQRVIVGQDAMLERVMIALLVFGNFLLADEINRAPAKVQSALLEVMQEQQVTIGGQTFQVPRPFLVMATQNPIEAEGTYPLPEAHVDRFLMKVLVDYPSMGEEAAVVGRSLGEEPEVRERLTLEDLERYRRVSGAVLVDRDVIGYAVALAEDVAADALLERVLAAVPEPRLERLGGATAA